MNLNEETVLSFEKIESKTLVSPFSKKDTIISLDPFLTEGNIATEEAQIEKLVERGYYTFVLNNLAHIKILKDIQKKFNLEDANLHLIGGPYLYAFNRYAIKYLEENIAFHHSNRKFLCES